MVKELININLLSLFDYRGLYQLSCQACFLVCTNIRKMGQFFLYHIKYIYLKYRKWSPISGSTIQQFIFQEHYLQSSFLFSSFSSLSSPLDLDRTSLTRCLIPLNISILFTIAEQLTFKPT